ncbi:MAG: nucleotide exchange factor GrpE [Methanobacteriota archaeon]|nr:MAG: nucleotide exchange factor GrpE [Euryarchaeota archaeon]
MSGNDPQTDAVEAEAAPPATAGDIEKLRAELEAATRRADDLLDRLRRAQADYENLQKRSAREVDEVRELANEALLASLLPILDDFDHAIAALPGDAGAGVRMLQANLWRALADAGLEAIDPSKMPFDPYEHEVVGQSSDEGLKDGTVHEVVQKGYRYRRRLLRPAKVIVVKRGA